MSPTCEKIAKAAHVAPPPIDIAAHRIKLPDDNPLRAELAQLVYAMPTSAIVDAYRAARLRSENAALLHARIYAFSAIGRFRNESGNYDKSLQDRIDYLLNLGDHATLLDREYLLYEVATELLHARNVSDDVLQAMVKYMKLQLQIYSPHSLSQLN